MRDILKCNWNSVVNEHIHRNTYNFNETDRGNNKVCAIIEYRITHPSYIALI